MNKVTSLINCRSFLNSVMPVHAHKYFFCHYNNIQYHECTKYFFLPIIHYYGYFIIILSIVVLNTVMCIDGVRKRSGCYSFEI